MVLMDSQMKDGDVSLVLKNLSSNDSGTYECRVITGRNKRAVIKVDPVRTITLQVTE